MGRCALLVGLPVAVFGRDESHRAVHTAAITAVVTHAGLLLSGSEDGTVRVWSARPDADGTCTFDCVRCIDVKGLVTFPARIATGTCMYETQ